MPILAKMVADSVSGDGIRLATLVCVYPRFIHSEVMTHRVFSRNAASSRAIPTETMLRSIEEDPAMPVWWGRNQSGMAAREELDLERMSAAKDRWIRAMRDAVEHGRALVDIGLHKQIANRVTEPWAHMETVVSSTEWDNFLGLRDHRAAQPEFGVLARAIREVLGQSTPQLLRYGQWHAPFVGEVEMGLLVAKEATLPAKVSAARCARVSYKRQEVPKGLEEDLQRHDEALHQGHMSPFEHQATPISGAVWCGNFRGWLQYRKTLPGEAVFSK